MDSELLPYVFLIIAVLSQLMVPRMVGNIIDAITGGVIAQNVVPNLDKVPTQFLPLLFQQLGYTPAELANLAVNADRMLITAGLAIVGFALVRGLFSFLQTFWAERNSQTVAFDMRNDLFSKIAKLSFSYHDRNQTGQLMVRATDDVEKVRIFIGQGLLQAVGALVLLVGTLIILLATNVKLTLIVLPILPLALVIFMVFSAVSQPLFVKVQQRLSALNTILQENLAGIKVVKAFRREKSEEQKFDTSAQAVMAQQIKVSPLVRLSFPAGVPDRQRGPGVGTVFRRSPDHRWHIDPGPVPGIQPIPDLRLPAPGAAWVHHLADGASLGVGRSHLRNPGHGERCQGQTGRRAAAAGARQGRVRQCHLPLFRWRRSGADVVSFEAEPGQTIALLGATGSGKTTIINLIPRFYDPSEGRVTIDGQDLRDVTLESLRSQIGIVLQETTLFSGTIRDNIAFGKPDASTQEVEAAARAAAAHDFILSFPQGYDTPVGERGTTLSGGQKQRIAIARALLMDPRLLILDDSTSAVDLETEYHIQKALDHLMQGRTSFVIAQRISTVMHADQILVLDKGPCRGQRQTRRSMETSEIYADIYTSQLIGDVEMEEA